MGLSQNLKVGLALEKLSEYMNQKGRCGPSYRDIWASQMREKIFFYNIQYPFVILKKILVKDETFEFPLGFGTRLDVPIFTISVQHCPRLVSTARQDKDSKI